MYCSILSLLPDVFVPVNKYGAQGRQRLQQMEQVLTSESLPSIHLSRWALLAPRSRYDVCDLEWRTSFIRMAQKYQRTIVPLYFQGTNSPSFIAGHALGKS